VERQACVLAAGGAGEQLYEEHENLRPRGKFHVGTDKRQTDAHLQCLHPDDTDAREAQGAVLRSKADAILRDRNDEVTNLAMRLYEEGTVASP
jgi:hypothetical protein